MTLVVKLDFSDKKETTVENSDCNESMRVPLKQHQK